MKESEFPLRVAVVALCAAVCFGLPSRGYAAERQMFLTAGGGVFQRSFPHADAAAGPAIELGFETPRVAFEMYLAQSSHRMSGVRFLEDGVKAEYGTLRFDLKYRLATGSFRPFVMAGCSLHHFSADDALHIGDIVSGDASYTGFGLNGGGGVEFYLMRRIALVVEASYHGVSFKPDIEITDWENRITDDLSGSGTNFGFGIKVGI